MQTNFSIDELIACASRELAMRKRVYPTWVSRNRITQDKAEHEIAMMAAIVRNLENQQQGELFDS